MNGTKLHFSASSKLEEESTPRASMITSVQECTNKGKILWVTAVWKPWILESNIAGGNWDVVKIFYEFIFIIK